MSETSGQPGLPIKKNINQALNLTLLLAALMGALALLGVLLPGRIYPSEALLETYLTNDLLNLMVGLPILILPVWLIRREVQVGLLCWPGAVLFVLYNALAYLTGLPFGLLPLAHLVIVFLCVFILYEFLRGINGETLQTALAGQVAEGLAGWVLVIFGVLFIARAGFEFSQMLVTGSFGRTPDLGVLIADIAISTCWIWGGVALLRRRPFGYASGLGLLFAGSMLFIGLIAFLILQPLVTEAAFSLTDVVVLAVMGLVCFVPSGLFARGVLSQK